MKITYILPLIFISFSSQSEVYKCLNDNGDVSYSHNECSENQKSEVLTPGSINEIEGSGIHYNFESASYKGKAYLVYNGIPDKYTCAEICKKDDQCLVATYFNEFSKKKNRFKCKLRSSIKNKEINAKGAESWHKSMPE